MPVPVPVNNRKDLLGFPKSYAIIIGINHYPHIDADLTSAKPDAIRLARVLDEGQGFDHVELLTDPSGDEIRKMLQNFVDPESEPRIQQEDCVLFYYAGHGKAGTFDRGPAGFLLPSDAKPKSAALENDSLIPMEEVFDALLKLNCHHTLLILDCCFAGKFRFTAQKSRDTVTPFFMPMFKERFERFKRQKAWQVLVSAGPDQTAADWMGVREDSQEKGIHSPFAQALFEALDGKAEIKPAGKNLGDGVLTVQELFLYLWEKVESITKADSGFRIQHPDLFPMGNHKGGQFIFFDPQNKLNFAERIERNPYKGLNAYQPEDNDLYFGRQADIEKVISKLRLSNTQLITAPSGFGKSSFVRAGLFPQLQPAGYTLVEMRPGARPWTTFQALNPLPESGKKILFLVDSYEEIYTECIDPYEKEQFERKLRSLCQRKGDLIILITIRSDFEWQLLSSVYGDFFKGADHFWKIYRLPPLGLEQMREILVNPALVEACDFESERLVDEILQEISYAPGALPLLSFTMSELYKITDKERRVFTRLDYKVKLGGVSGALSSVADKVYKTWSDKNFLDNNMFQKVMLRMVNLKDGTYLRRRVPVIPASQKRSKDIFHELDYPEDRDDNMANSVIRQLEEAQLVISAKDQFGQPFIEPVHDALINFWPQCLQWIKGFGEDRIVLQRQLWEAVKEYSHASEETQENFLWNENPKLKQLKNLYEADDNWLNALEHEFVKKSLAAQEEEIERIKKERDEARASALATKALLNVTSNNTLGLNLAMEAYHISPTEEASTVLHDILSNTDNRFLRIKKVSDHVIFDNSNVTAVALTKDGEIVATAHEDLVVRIWKQGFNDPAFMLSGHENPVRILRCSPDGKYLLSAGDDLFAFIWDLETGHHLWTLDEPYLKIESFVDAAYTPDSETVLTLHRNNTLRVWDPQIGRLAVIKDVESRVLAISATTENFFLGFENMTYEKRDKRGKRIARRFLTERPGGGGPDKSITESCYAMAISPECFTIVSCLSSGKIVFHDISDRTIPDMLPKHYIFQNTPVDVSTVSFSSYGQYVIMGSNSEGISVWEAVDGTPLFHLKHLQHNPSDISSIACNRISKAGTKVLAIYSGRAFVWELDVSSLWYFEAHEKRVNAIAKSHSGKFFATVSEDGTAKIFDSNSKQLLHILNHGCALSSVTFSTEEKLLTGSSKGEIKMWDTRTGEVVDSFKIEGFNGPLIKLCWLEENNEIYALCDDNSIAKNIAIWTVLTRQQAFTASPYPFLGKTLFSFVKQYPGKYILNPDRQTQETSHVPGGNDDLTAIVLSPDKSLIATAGWGPVIQVWDAKTHSLLHRLNGHQAPVFDLAFDGERLLSCAKDRMVKTWDARKGWLLHTMDVDDMPVKVLPLNGHTMILTEGGSVILISDIIAAMESGNIPKLNDEQRKQFGL